MLSNKEEIEDIFKGLCNNLIAEGRITEYTELFGSLSSNDERVLFVYELLDDYNLFPKLNDERKSDDKSKLYRLEGNKAFGQKNDCLALVNYNKSLAFADPTKINNEHLSLTFANRSAVLFEMKFYKECLQDIERAIQNGYPEHLVLKLNQRSQKANELINDSKQFKYFSEVPEIKSINPFIDCASDKVCVQYSKDLGRYVTANEDISPGEILAVEEPYITILLNNFIYTHCANCLKRIFNPVPCSNCPYAVFCDETCRDIAWKDTHKFECPMIGTLTLLNVDKMARLALRVTLKMKNSFMELEKYNSDVEKSKIGFDFVNGDYVYKSKSCSSIHNLVTNTSLRPMNDLFHKATTCAVMLYLIQQCTDFFDEDDMIEESGNKNIVAELLLRHIQTAPSNMHEISEFSKSEGFNSSEFGAGAYSFLSLLNHSCAPNVVRHCHGTTIILRALGAIKKGEQICDNYGYHYAVSEKIHRKVSLKNQYYFTCECQACEEDWPLYENMISKEPKLKSVEKLDDIIQELRCGELKTALDSWSEITESAKALRDYAPCTELATIEEIMKQCFALQGNAFSVD